MAIGTRIGATVSSTAMTPIVTTTVDMIVTRPNTTAVDCEPAATRARCMRSAKSELS